jgi:hypothetical protein
MQPHIMRGIFHTTNHTAHTTPYHARYLLDPETYRAYNIISCAVSFTQRIIPRIQPHIMRGIFWTLKLTAHTTSYHARYLLGYGTYRAYNIISCAVSFGPSHIPRMQPHIMRDIFWSLKYTAHETTYHAQYLSHKETYRPPNLIS